MARVEMSMRFFREPRADVSRHCARNSIGFGILEHGDRDMFCSCGLHRRGVLKLASGFAAALGTGRVRSAQAQTVPPSVSGSGGALPARGEFLVRGGHVL